MAGPANRILESEGPNIRELATYFVLAYGMSIVLWLPVLTGRRSYFFFSLGTFGPTLAALATRRVFYRDWRAVQLWSTLRDLMSGVAIGASA